MSVVAHYIDKGSANKGGRAVLFIACNLICMHRNIYKQEGSIRIAVGSPSNETNQWKQQ
jgi:hypothetical protein